ncbi:IS1182 family transposase [Sphingobacterium wenxiniae]|uniref:Transposase n=1 Tax=Sphingobacterium wenxiniae TaxID=683125 RepID=A0A1I6TF57_9SPHI|nr:IS1182 family transposase [Sphingobacterium wenxiniae]SFS87830.1 Transposase [Sphingobacterium wenxiniae]
MKFIVGKDRNQTEFFCLEQAISQENEVRLIDLFVSAINMKDYGFDMNFVDNGRPAYHPAVLLKLYIYGYLNRIRSSRALEKECKRNIELMWLLKTLVPDHNTIANFRKNNPKAIRKIFHATVALAKNFDLIGAKLLAGDSTKLRAQNSKKNNFNPTKIKRHLDYIDEKLSAYNTILDEQDNILSDAKKIEIQQKIAKHNLQKNKYHTFQKQLEETNEVQISSSDPDSRQLITRNNITEVAYNVQTTVDAKHNIPIDFKVTNQNDSKAMGNMVRRAKNIIGKSDFILLYDKGYHTGTEFDYAHKQGVSVMVAVPEVASHAPNIAFDVANFRYDKKLDHYTCPAGQQLQTNGRWYFKKHGKTTNRMKHYKTAACKSCSLFEPCTKNKAGRLIERTEHAELIEANKQRIINNKELYRRRQAFVEHPFGIIKRQWGFYYIMTKKTIKHASADVGLIFTAFNLRRIFNLIDKNTLQKHLIMLACFYYLFVCHFKLFLGSFLHFVNTYLYNKDTFIIALNRVYLTNRS